MRMNRFVLAVAAPAALAAALAVPSTSGASSTEAAAQSFDCRDKAPPCVVYCYVAEVNRRVPCGVRLFPPIEPPPPSRDA